MNHCIIKNGYVVNVVVAEDIGVVPTGDGETVVTDPEGIVGIGDWYEEAEGVFYRPLSDPPDRLV